MTVAQLKYNPGICGDEELIQSFVVRKSTFELILETLRENIGPANQHVLIVGPRGSGKTTLVRRVAAEVRIDPALNTAWYPIVFAEESYLVSSSGEFWLEALFHLGDQTQDVRWERAYRELQEERDEARLRDRALAQLMDFADGNGTRLLLVVENLNMLLGEQMANGADWELRHTLLNEPRVMLIGTATKRFNEVENIDRAWFELFAIHDLKPLSQEECQVLWESATGSDLQAWKLRPIQILTGGNPRLMKILAEFAVRRSLHELMDHLVHLIDEHTEYFKSHLDGLAPMERKVFVALLELWDPASAKEVGHAARMGANRVSVHLNRLVQRGAVEVLTQNGRRKIYQVAERLYNIYYLMRRRGHPSNRVRAAVGFMIQFYERYDLIAIAVDIAEEACRLPSEQRKDHYSAYQDIVNRSRETKLKFEIIKSTSKAFFETPDIPTAILKIQNEIYGRTQKNLDIFKALWVGPTELDETTERQINELIERGPINDMEWILVGKYNSRRGRSDEAITNYRKAIELESDSASLAWAFLGETLHENHSRYAEAEEAYRRAIEMQQDFVWAWMQLGLLLNACSRYDEAEVAFRKATKISPENMLAWAYLGQLLHEQSRYDEAEVVFRRIIPWSWARLGLLFHELSRYDEAEEAYKNAIEFRPHLAWTWVHLGLLLQERSRCDQAENVFRKAMEIKLDHGWAWEQLREMLRKRRPQYSEEQDYLRMVVEVNNALRRAFFLAVGDIDWREERDTIVAIIDAAPGDSGAASEATKLLMTLAAVGHAEEALQLLSASKGAAVLEPLLVGLQVFLGESPCKAQEIMEVAEDVARRIRDARRAYLRLTANENPGNPASDMVPDEAPAS